MKTSLPTLDLTLAVHAGGLSSRMGEDKALKPFLGRPLIQRVIDRLSPLAAETLVTTNDPAGYGFLNLALVPDRIPGKGALGGLYTALEAAVYPIVAMLACDMPFASPELLQVAFRLMEAEAADVVLPRSPDGLEPLHALYRRETCLPVVAAAIKANRLQVIAWFPKVRVRELTREEITAADPAGMAFLNINTAEDFLRAERLARGRDQSDISSPA
jgi:molybdopterin-guanine dinucleotide biosynthesis protein A